MTWYLICAIFAVGLWAVIALPNLVRKVVGLSIMNTAVILFFVFQGSILGRVPPIVTDASADTASFADPLPQALMLTAIVVGICIVAVALVIVYRLYQRYQTLDIRELERVIWKPESHASE